MPLVLSTWRFVALTLWAVGVQTHEALCTVGMAALVVSFVPEVTKLRRAHLLAWWPLLGFIGWSLLAPTLGGNPPDGTGLARTLDWLSIPFAAAAFAGLTEVQRTRFVTLTVGTLALSCVVAGLQHFGWWPAESAFASFAWLRIPFNRVYEPISEGATRYMGGGLLFHRLKFSHVSGLVLVGLVVLAAQVKSRGLVIALTAFGLFAVWLFPYARMGAVAATAGVAVAVLLSSKHRARAVLVLGAVGLAGVVLVASVDSLRARFAAGLTDQGSGQRTQHLGAGLEAIRQHPWVGVGPGQFRPARFGGAEMAEHVKDNPGKAHNQLVSIAAETGVPGALAFVALLGWLVVQARKRGDGVLAAGLVAQFAVLSLVHDPLFQAPYSMALVLGLGLAAAERKPATTSGEVG